MFHRKDAVFMAVAGLLASSGYAVAGNTPSAKLTLDPAVLTADDAAPEPAPLMGLLDKAGVGKPISDAGVNIYGWIEAGYTYNHRHHGDDGPIVPGPFNHEVGNHFMLNQLDLRFERQVDPTKLDVGGMVEVMYGTDAGFIHSSGLGFNGNDPTDDGVPADRIPDKFQANYQFDVTQAYVDVNLPVGNGLKIRIGKFVTLLSNETIDPRGNLFYSHSYLFNAVNFTDTGVLAFYKFNDQWSAIAGVTRGWDMSLEDTNGAVDATGQVAWTPNKQWSVLLNWNVGPQNRADTSHYRTVIDPIVSWQVTDQLKLAVEGLYEYDGGMNGDATTGVSHAYGDVWGAALYASYMLNEYVTLNGRFEKFHSYSDSVGALAAVPLNPDGSVSNTNVYSSTIGATITPLPKDPIGKNLSIRPEIRYDWSEDHIFTAGTGAFKDQLTFGADVIFKF